jgi:hypothetical protein
MIRQPQIIVRGKIDQLSPADSDTRTLGGIHAAQFAQQSPLADGGEALSQF